MPDYYREFNTSYRTQYEKQQHNAKYFTRYLLSKGWTLNAICGALGNWQVEATMNTNDPQYITNYPSLSASTGEVFSEGGFGLAQWTPVRNKIGWYAQQKGLTFDRTDTNPPSSFEFQMEYHEFECTYGLKGDSSKKTWYPEKPAYYLPWEEYKKSTKTPEELAEIYYWSYERSSAWDSTTRPRYARTWFDYLQGISPLPSKSKSKFIVLAYGSGLFK